MALTFFFWPLRLLSLSSPVHMPALFQFSSVQSLSHVRLFVTPWLAAHQASLSIANSRSSPKLMSIELVIPSNHLIVCHPLLLPPSIFPSIRVFSNESALCIRWPKYWSFSFNINLSNEHSGLISFRMGWLDLLAVHMGWSFNHENHILAQPLFYLPTLMFSTRTCECVKLTNRRRKRKRRNITLNQISYQIIYFSMLFSKNMLSPLLSNSYSH